MKTTASFLAFVMLFLGIQRGSRAQETQQETFMVFPSHCIEIVQQETTALELPMVDGKADVKHGRLIHVLVNIKDQSCGGYEVRSAK